MFLDAKGVSAWLHKGRIYRNTDTRELKVAFFLKTLSTSLQRKQNKNNSRLRRLRCTSYVVFVHHLPPSSAPTPKRYAGWHVAKEDPSRPDDKVQTEQSDKLCKKNIRKECLPGNWTDMFFFWLPPKKKSHWLTQPTDHEIKVETLFSFQVVVIPKSLVRLARKLMEKGFRSSSQNPSHPLFSLMRSYVLTRRVDNLAAYSSFLGMLSLLFNPAAYPLKKSS